MLTKAAPVNPMVPQETIATHNPNANTMEPAKQMSETSEQVNRRLVATFPEPRLQIDDVRDMNVLRENNDKQMNEYQWIDPKAGSDGHGLYPANAKAGLNPFDENALTTYSLTLDSADWDAMVAMMDRKKEVTAMPTETMIPPAFIGLLQGKNFGKMLVRVGEDKSRR